MSGEQQPTDDINAHIAHLQVVREEAERVQVEQAERVRQASEAVMNELVPYVGSIVLLTGRPSYYTHAISPDPDTKKPRTVGTPLSGENREERTIRGIVSRLDSTVITIALIEPSDEEGKAVTYGFPVEDITHIAEAPITVD